MEVRELRRRLGKFTENAGEDDEGNAAPLFDLKVLKLKEQTEMERLRALNEILTSGESMHDWDSTAIYLHTSIILRKRVSL